jgi:hypothetical protein
LSIRKKKARHGRACMSAAIQVCQDRRSTCSPHVNTHQTVIIL